MIQFQLTPTHFAELAWAKMRITREGRDFVTVPDIVRLLNLERAMLDAQRHEAHTLADVVAQRDATLAAELRGDADRRHDARWREIGDLISTLGGMDGPARIDWTCRDIVAFACGSGVYDPELYARAQATQIYVDHGAAPGAAVGATSPRLARAHWRPPSDRGWAEEDVLRWQQENGLRRGHETPPEVTKFFADDREK